MTVFKNIAYWPTTLIFGSVSLETLSYSSFTDIFNFIMVKFTEAGVAGRRARGQKEEGA